MSSRRFVLLLCAVLIGTTSFAATKKSDRDRDRSKDWSDLSLQNGSLADIGSSVSGGVENLMLLQGGGPLGPPVQGPGTPDNWNGGTGKWSVAGNWNNGEPGAGSDVTIYSGGTDTVTLDVGSTTINSLTLGGASNGHTSELTDNGTKQTLTITNALNVGVTGELYLSGGSTVTAGANSSNSGEMFVSGGSSLTVTGNLMFAAGSELGLSKASTLTVNGNLTNNSNSFYTGYGIVTSGGSNMLNVNGAFTNNGAFYMYGNQEGGGGSGDTLTVTGTLTNAAGATFELIANSGAVANVNALSNSGTLLIGTGTTLDITGGDRG